MDQNFCLVSTQFFCRKQMLEQMATQTHNFNTNFLGFFCEHVDMSSGAEPGLQVIWKTFLSWKRQKTGKNCQCTVSLDESARQYTTRKKTHLTCNPWSQRTMDVSPDQFCTAQECTPQVPERSHSNERVPFEMDNAPEHHSDPIVSRLVFVSCALTSTSCLIFLMRGMKVSGPAKQLIPTTSAPASFSRLHASGIGTRSLSNVKPSPLGDRFTTDGKPGRCNTRLNKNWDGKKLEKGQNVTWK